MHEVSETALRDGTDPRQYIGNVFNEREIRKEHVAQIVKPYVDYVRAEAAGYILRVETKFELNDAVGGTADAVVLGDDFIHVIDLKTGRQFVDVVDNTQLMIYALGAYLKYGTLMEVKRIGMTIFQPMANNRASHWISLDALMDFAKELFAIHKRIVALDVVFVASDSNCQYCPAATICPVLHEKAVEQARVDFFPEMLSGEELTEKLKLAQLLLPWFEALKAEAKARIEKGVDVPGYELKAGRTMYAWADEVKAARALRRAGIEGVWTEPTLRSPAQVRQLIKDQHAEFELDNLLTATSAEPSLAPAKQTQTVDKTESAKADFRNVKKSRK